MIALRLFMGFQMLMYGVMCAFNPSELHGAYWFDESGWKWWVALLIIGGVWLALFAALEIYAIWNCRGLGTKKCRICVKASSVARIPGYFFCGAVWAGLGFTLLFDGHIQTVDIMAPAYMLFLLFIAYKDACKKRRRALRQHETDQQG